KFREICELAINYYKGLYHSEKECHELKVIEDEYMHLQKLAKTMFAILESIAQIYLFYVSNVKKELSFCDNNMEMELHSSIFNKIIFAEINGPDLSKDDNNKVDHEVDDEVEFISLMANEITIAFQD
ncbi:6620_t:CDS:2, partial [Gigaspora margarita]